MIKYRHELDAVLRRDFLSFVERAYYELNPHKELSISPYLERLAGALERCRTGECRRLIICVPPRHLKSHCASVAFPAWLLGHDPAARIICASYGQELAENHARDCRKLMNSPLYKRLFSTRLSDRQAINECVTTANGSRRSTSLGGALTGLGGDYLIIDDPMKPDEALSEGARKSVNKWYDGTLRTRLDNQQSGCIIIVMQRLHQDDLVGHVLEQGEEWEVVSLPAIAEEEEAHTIESVLGQYTYRRMPGDLLDPARDSMAILNNLRNDLGEYFFSAQFQQNPVPEGGNIIRTEWLRYYEPHEKPSHFTYTLLSVDSAYKVKEVNDYSVATIWGYLSGNYYLLHVFRRRLEYPGLKREVLRLAKEFRVDKILIEDKASGTSLIQDLKAEGMLGIVPYEVSASMEKEMRMRVQAQLFEQSKVLLPAQASWRDEYIRELTGFPGTRYDDQVDSTAQALDYMKNKSKLAVWEKLGLAP